MSSFRHTLGPLQIVYILSVAGLLFIGGCNLPEGTVPSTTAEDGPLVVTPASTEELLPTPTSAPGPTLEPTLMATPELTAIVPQNAAGALLIEVSEKIEGVIGQPRKEVWLLEAGETIPHVLLQSQKYSMESPVWSHNGGWIAFRQVNIPARRTEVGLIRKDGTEQHLVTDEEFGSVSLPRWSWDDRWLTFTTRRQGKEIAYAVDMKTSVSRTLNPDPNTMYTDLWLFPSPRDNTALLIGKVSVNSEEHIEMWLVSLDEQGGSVRILPETWLGCSWFSSIAWAPDGQSFILQPGNYEFEKSCKAQLWHYDIARQLWSEVAQPPSGIYPTRVEWSPDGRWVAWKVAGWHTALVYDAATWDHVREINAVGLTWLPWSWMRDSAGNSVLVAVDPIYSQGRETYALLGFSPNGTEQDDKVVAQILRGPDWLPANSTYFPLVWQP